MADEQPVVPPEGASEETPGEDNPAAEEQGDDTAAETTAEGENTAEGDNTAEGENTTEGDNTAGETTAETETDTAEKAEADAEAAPETGGETEKPAEDAGEPEAEPEGDQTEPEVAEQQEAVQEETTAPTEGEEPAQVEQAQEVAAEQTEEPTEPAEEPQPETEAPELTEEERETFLGLFNMYATEDDGDGEKKITKAGIKLLFRFMGEIVTDAIVSRWLQEEDKDVDGKFDFEEFCSLYKKKRQPEDERKEELLLSVNTLFPINGDNDTINLDTVASLMKVINTQPGLISENSVLTEDDVNYIISKIDTDGSKSITRREFVEFLCSKGE